MSFDHLLFKQYHSKTYNCAHFMLDAWRAITGHDLPENVQASVIPEGTRTVGMMARQGLIKINVPISPCIVVMTKHGYEPHVGVYYDGRIYHLKPSGVEFARPDIASLGFHKVSYYSC